MTIDWLTTRQPHVIWYPTASLDAGIDVTELITQISMSGYCVRILKQSSPTYCKVVCQTKTLCTESYCQLVRTILYGTSYSVVLGH